MAACQTDWVNRYNESMSSMNGFKTPTRSGDLVMPETRHNPLVSLILFSLSDILCVDTDNNENNKTKRNEEVLLDTKSCWNQERCIHGRFQMNTVLNSTRYQEPKYNGVLVANCQDRQPICHVRVQDLEYPWRQRPEISIDRRCRQHSKNPPHHMDSNHYRH